jgi:transposase
MPDFCPVPVWIGEYLAESYLRESVLLLIETECGVTYHPGHVWRILRQLGWSCQRPAGRALERNEEKIRQWKQQRWPEIKKKPKTGGAPSFSSTKAD